MLSLEALLNTLWLGLQGFVYYYPVFMSYLWMMGAAVFYWRWESKQPRFDAPVPLPGTPPISILIPCYNEAAHAEETLSHALALDYPDFEVIAINDGSRDNTGQILDRMAREHPRLRVVHLAQNQGKAMGLQAGALLARHEILIGIDGDALLDPHCAHWMVRHFVEDPDVAAVTGNPRIRNRSTLLGRVQVGEFSSIVGMIKRAQRTFGRLFTVSGVITAFRKSAVHQVGYWSPDMLTEDIDITWKLQRDGWDVRFEPRALVWILMPETLRGLWKQRLRWATGGAQVLAKNLDVVLHPSQNHLWPLLLELVLSLVWSYALLAMVVVWLLGLVLPHGIVPLIGSPLIPQWSGVLLGTTCLLQFGISRWLDGHYDTGLGRNYYWMIWYPAVFWLINTAATVVAFPKALFRSEGKRARWISPDRGAHLRKKKRSRSLTPVTQRLIINARRELSWRRRVLSDLVTALMWFGWILLWLPVFDKLHKVISLHMFFGPAAIQVLDVITPISLSYALIALLGTSGLLMLWALLPTRRLTHAHVEQRLDDYAGYFELDARDVLACQDSRVCLVHHDERGRIISVEPRE